jgi:hypothetical protein
MSGLVALVFQGFWGEGQKPQGSGVSWEVLLHNVGFGEQLKPRKVDKKLASWCEYGLYPKTHVLETGSPV